MTLSDPRVVASEYATDARLRRRSLYESAIYEGPDAREHALLALHEAGARRILDVGCGTGEFAERAARVLGATVYAADQSPHMVELTRARGIEAEIADVDSLPYGDRSFDAVPANWMLYHLPDLDGALAELARVLRPGGCLVAIVNGERHLEEIWGPAEPDGFTAATAADALARRFARVERRDVRGAATFVSEERLRRYLNAFGTLHGRDETVRLAVLRAPLRVTCWNVILVADSAA